MQDDEVAGEADEGLDYAPSDPRYWTEVLGGTDTAARLVQQQPLSLAILKGEPRAVYAALRKMRRTARSLQERELIESALKQRRLFAEPIDGAPSMTTINGIGTTCRGFHDPDPTDGTGITTHWVTVLWLPLWPLRQYLARQVGDGAWQFFARVPMSGFHRWWRRGLATAVAVTACLIFLAIRQRETHDDVHFFNGLNVAVTVSLADQEVPVPPGGHVGRELSQGDYHVIVRNGAGAVLEEQDVTVPGGHDFVAYNVLGAAPLYSEWIVYTADGVTPPDEDSQRAGFRSFAGRTWVTLESVHYVLRDPPSTIDMARGVSLTRHTRLGLGQGDWRTAVAQLAAADGLPAAAALARRVALLDPAAETDVEYAYHFSRAAGDVPTTRAFVEAVLATRPDSVAAHRLFQMHMEEQDSVDEIRARYRADYEANPQSARAAYLHARLEPFAVARPIYEAAVPIHPDDSWLRRGLAWICLQSGDFEAAATHYERLSALRPREAGAIAYQLAHALAGVGRDLDALQAVHAALVGGGTEGDPFAGGELWSLMGMYHTLRVRVGNKASYPPPAELLRPLLGVPTPDPTALGAVAAHARDADSLESLRARIQDAQALLYFDLMVLSRADVERAAGMAREAGPNVLSELDMTAAVAIACELLRLGQPEKAAACAATVFDNSAAGLSLGDLEALPDVSGLREDLDVRLRAALLHAAARRLEDGEARRALLSEARRLDALDQVVPH